MPERTTTRCAGAVNIDLLVVLLCWARGEALNLASSTSWEVGPGWAFSVEPAIPFRGNAAAALDHWAMHLNASECGLFHGDHAASAPSFPRRLLSPRSTVLPHDLRSRPPLPSNAPPLPDLHPHPSIALRRNKRLITEYSSSTRAAPCASSSTAPPRTTTAGVTWGSGTWPACWAPRWAPSIRALPGNDGRQTRPSWSRQSSC